MKESNELKTLLVEEKLHRRVAFCSVLVCTVAVVACAVCLPMVYNYIQYVQSLLNDEMEFCMVSFLVLATKKTNWKYQDIHLTDSICVKLVASAKQGLPVQ